MNRDDIIRMAQEAGWENASRMGWHDGFWQRLERFAALVAVAEREALKEERRRDMAEIYSLRESEESLREENERLREALTVAVKAEREACAAICDEMMRQLGEIGETIEAAGAGYCAEEIRNRGET